LALLQLAIVEFRQNTFLKSLFQEFIDFRAQIYARTLILNGQQFEKRNLERTRKFKVVNNFAKFACSCNSWKYSRNNK
jgi:hypothetical protein